MLLESVVVTGDGDTVRREARCHWAEGTFTIETSAPAELAETTSDPAGFVCVALPIAMRLGEDLEVVDPVSATLLTGLEQVQMAYDAWVTPLSRVALRASARADGGLPPTTVRSGGRRACLLSRGLDSMFTVARARAAGSPFDQLVFIDGLEPRHDPEVRRREIEAAGVLAGALGSPLAVAGTNVRLVTDSFGFDWEDVLAAGLASVGHSLAGGIASVTLPPTHSYRTFRACGSSPLLDHHYSSDRLAVEHGPIDHTRLDKIGWLATHEPGLLSHLKVCYAANRSDNCGSCPKCVLTMLQLHVHGALAHATQFPGEIPPPVVRAVEPRDSYQFRVEWALTASRLATTGADGELRRAMGDVLVANTLSTMSRPIRGRWLHHQTIGTGESDSLLALFLEGRTVDEFPRAAGPSGPRPPSTTIRLTLAGDGRLGLRSATEPTDHHHETVRVLGALLTVPMPTAVPVWVTDDGHLLVRGMADPDGATATDPTGFVHLHPAADRVPLLLGRRGAGDPVVDTDPEQIRSAGATDVVVIGYLEA